MTTEDLLLLADQYRDSGSPAARSVLAAKLDALCAERDAANALLRDLLAVIHRDGGHYTGAHGIEKSALDARAVVNADRVALDAANTLLREWLDPSIDGIGRDELRVQTRAHLGAQDG